jgi:transglutaminase-like putative cysteine protease
VPYWPVQLTAPGNWREADGTLMIFSSQANHAGQTYTVTNGEAEPTPAELSAAQQVPGSIRRTYLGFKSPQTAQLRKIALGITHGKTTAFAKAVALEQWFHSSRFTYSLQPAPVRGPPASLLTFLTSTRRGYCQQFAFAMAVLARLIGIPSRVAIGYTAGTERANGTWRVNTADAHAWPELYFANAGWLRFEPTPGGSAGQDSATEPSYVIAATPGHDGNPRPGSSTGSSGGPSISPTTGPFRGKKVVPQEGAAGSTRSSHGGGAAPLGWSLLAVLVLLAAAPGVTRLGARGRRWRGARDDATLAQAAWQELCADLDDYGLTCLPSESPRAVARRVGAAPGLDEEGRLAVGRIASVVERAKYAPAPGAAGAVRADVSLARRSLARSVGVTVRLRARLLPASTLGPVRGAVRQGLGLLTGWVPAQGQSG